MGAVTGVPICHQHSAPWFVESSEQKPAGKPQAVAGRKVHLVIRRPTPIDIARAKVLTEMPGL